MINPYNSTGGSSTNAINASGQVLGHDDDGNVFLWTSNGTTLIVNGFGSTPVHAADLGSLNDSGQVAGYVEGDESDDVPYIWSSGSGSMTSINNTLGSGAVNIYGLNNSGQVVGYTSGSPDAAFVWTSGGGMTQLTNSYGSYAAEAHAINNSGQVAGLATDAGSNLQAVRWESNGDMTVIGAIDGGVAAINSAGQVVGDNRVYVESVDGNYSHAFLWDGTTMQDLGALDDEEDSYAFGVNASGMVVGQSTGESTGDRAFLYASGTMYDLNTLAADYLVSGSTVGIQSLYGAYGINDAGQIVGLGAYYDGSDYIDVGFLLTTASAVPEPSTYAVIAGALVLGFACWRRRQTTNPRANAPKIAA